ncbi:MAG: D-alanyl-D-alanine carboxypeptidase [Proteobacteria bacterium]|nr:D-alanyl-D-alanine carboxypeptidase [Pseudomonadota bacterium]
MRRQALRLFCFLLAFCFLISSPTLARKSASIVICAETGKVQHEQNADAITHPASLTKMMTLYLTFKALRDGKLTLKQKLPVSKFASKQSPCKLWLKPGTTISVRDAILGLITKSANDAAAVLGEALGNGSEAKFAQIMTSQAQKLGMSKTIFKNASGLPHKQQVTTARDMATLSRALYKHFPDYFPLFKTKQFTHKGVVHANHNKLLGKVKGVDGIKTGFINASGFNLAASMVRDNRRIIAVVMGGDSAKSRDQKMVKLLEATHSKMRKNPIFQEDDYDSIENLIYTLGSSDEDVTPAAQKTGRITKASYLPKNGGLDSTNDQFASVEDLLKSLGDETVIKNKPKVIKASTKKPVKKQKKKASGKPKSKPNVKKTTQKKKRKKSIS